MRGNSDTENEELVGPAKLHAFHVQRALPPGRGPRTGKAWRNIIEHPLTFTFEKGKLSRGDPRFTAEERYDAGMRYRSLCEILISSGRDSTDLDAAGGGASAVPLSEAKADAMQRLAAIDRGLKARDRRILRHVLGEGWSPNQAVTEACGHGFYANTAIARFVEALDALIEAMANARR